MTLSGPFLDRLVAPLVSDSWRAAMMCSLIGAPLAQAVCERFVTLGKGEVALDLAALKVKAQIAAVEATATRGRVLSFLNALNSAGIECMVIKGLATAMVLYPHPALRLLPDVDILVRPPDLPHLVAHMRDAGFKTAHVPGAERKWGALTVSSFAPVMPPEGDYLIDVHQAVDDPPACNGVPADEIFAASRLVDVDGVGLRVPGANHMFALLVLNAFRDLYEPRGLKSLFDATLLLANAPPDMAALGDMARRGAFVRRAAFYRELCLELGVGDVSALVPDCRLGPLGRHLLRRTADNMKSFTLMRFPDTLKLAFEMALYDSPSTMARRNVGRLMGLVRPHSHALAGLPVEALDP